MRPRMARLVNRYRTYKICSWKPYLVEVKGGEPILILGLHNLLSQVLLAQVYGTASKVR